jgi:hypothetical protein
VNGIGRIGPGSGLSGIVGRARAACGNTLAGTTSSRNGSSTVPLVSGDDSRGVAVAAKATPPATSSTAKTTPFLIDQASLESRLDEPPPPIAMKKSDACRIHPPSAPSFIPRRHSSHYCESGHPKPLQNGESRGTLGNRAPASPCGFCFQTIVILGELVRYEANWNAL